MAAIFYVNVKGMATGIRQHLEAWMWHRAGGEHVAEYMIFTTIVFIQRFYIDRCTFRGIR